MIGPDVVQLSGKPRDKETDCPRTLPTPNSSPQKNVVQLIAESGYSILSFAHQEDERGCLLDQAIRSDCRMWRHGTASGDTREEWFSPSSPKPICIAGIHQRKNRNCPVQGSAETCMMFSRTTRWSKLTARQINRRRSRQPNRIDM